MTRPSTPRGRIKRNVSMQPTGATSHVTSMGTLLALRMGWDILDIDFIRPQNGLSKRSGVCVTDLAFSAVAGLFVQAESNVQLEKASCDPVFGARAVMDSADESTFSRFFNDNCFWWPGVIVSVVQNLEPFDLTQAERRYCLFDHSCTCAHLGNVYEGMVARAKEGKRGGDSSKLYVHLSPHQELWWPTDCSDR